MLGEAREGRDTTRTRENLNPSCKASRDERGFGFHQKNVIVGAEMTERIHRIWNE